MIRGLATVAVCLGAALYGQPAAAPHFEVASIKPSNDPPGHSGSDSDRGRLTMTNVTLKRCIMGAYAIGPNQIVGGPDWLDSDRFQISAKAEGPANDAAINAMLQTLLAERFQLVVHRETRTIPAFVLEVAKNGPKVENSEGSGNTTNSQRGRIEAKGTSMKMFAEVLSRQMELPVVDQTGLEGVFSFTLQWTPESTRPVKPEETPEGPSVFTAIQEQLGLRLRSQKAPVEVLVVERAEKPSEN
jgi:uncharacterized protein (TIGR03435 family)